MNFSEAMQMLGTKLQGKYGHLGFKYKKSDKTLTRHSKNYTYMIAFSSFGGNTKDSIARTVLEYMNHLEHAPAIQAMGLSEPYQALAEFNGTVLAGRLTSSGVKFVTWDWDFNHTGLNHGHYYEGNYVGAKRDFAIRSGLIPDERQFTTEQLIEIYQQSAYIRFSCSLPEERERTIDAIQQRIQELVPDCEERVTQSLENNTGPSFEQTM